MRLDRKHKGILLILMAAFCFAWMNTCVRMAGDVPTLQKSFFRNLVALAIAIIMLVREGKGFRPNSRKNWPDLFLRSCIGTIGVLANFYAVDRLLLADANMLGKMAPFFAVIASVFLLKEKLAPIQVLSLVGAFVGALFIIKPTFSNMDLLPSLVGLVGGAGAGVAYTFVRKLSKNGERGTFIVFFFSLFSCLIAVPYLLFFYQPMTLRQLLWLFAAGLCAAGGQFSITGAYSCAPAREISVYDYSQVIFSAIIGFLLFRDMPDGFSFLGYFVIIGMAALNFWYSNRHTDAQ